MPPAFLDRRVALFGQLGSLTRRELQNLVRKLGGKWIDPASDEVDLLILGADAICDPPGELLARAHEVIGEAHLWQQLDASAADAGSRRWYTPAMIAALLNVPVAMVRRWHRAGLIEAAKMIHRLPFFDFAEIAVCRQLLQLDASGAGLEEVKRSLTKLSARMPGITRPLAQLNLAREGRQWLLRRDGQWLEPGGQRRLEFDEENSSSTSTATLAFRPAGKTSSAGSDSPAQLVEQAEVFDAEGNPAAAAECYRAALARGGPQAEWNARLADCLFRLGDLTAARERFYAALELDENLLEARVSLGCVLWELGQVDLAEAAWRGALALHEAHPDTHYHLARLFDEQQRAAEAETHWERFLQLSPESPWRSLAEQRLERRNCL